MNGLKFLASALDPRIAQHYTRQEYDDLKQAAMRCVGHIVGKGPLPEHDAILDALAGVDMPSSSSLSASGLDLCLATTSGGHHVIGGAAQVAGKLHAEAPESIELRRHSSRLPEQRVLQFNQFCLKLRPTQRFSYPLASPLGGGGAWDAIAYTRIKVKMIMAEKIFLFVRKY